MNLGSAIVILPYMENLKSYLPFGMTNVTFDFGTKHTNCVC